MQGINGGLSGNYVLGGNIDATSTASWNTGAGFTPIGDQSTTFSGKFDGLGHTISNVTINLPEQFSVGLFGRSTGLIQNVGMVGGSVTGAQYVGSLVGFLLSANGVLNNTYATGSVTGGRWTGGLIGASMGAISISNSYATGNVYGGANGLQIGGLFGQLSGSLTNSYATGNVTAGAQVGGLGGKNYGGTITNSYATGNVTGGTLSTQVGGLVGYNYGGSISNSYATGRVTGGSQVGGLVGWGTNVSSISNSYATGSVTGTTGAGGLVGENSNSTITNSYATGSVTGDTDVGGLVGYNYGFYKLSTSHATGSVSGSTRVGGLVGWNYGWVDNSYATGNVTGSTLYAGGLTGFNQRMIDNSYATGNVAGVSSVGGLAGGTEYGTPTNNYSTGIVSGSSHVGGLVGILLNGATLTHNYWNTTNNPTLPGVADVGTGSGAGATGLTTQQMQTASNFVGFNFTGTPGAVGNNWVIVNTDGTLNNAGGATGATSPMLATEYSTTINNAHQLQLMAMDPAASYTLGANINAAATAGGDVWGRVSAGFTPTFAPVGKETTPFSGSFDGLGHTISGLTINLPSQDQVGLFGRTSASAVIQNVGLVGGSVSGRSYVGVLVGDNYGGTISNSYSTGTVTGSDLVGGIVGANYGTISNSYATGSVNGRGYVGGLVGLNNYGTINNSYTTGSVTGSGNFVGGLVGFNHGAINNSYAMASVYGSTQVGGLVGYNYDGSISNSYATGSVTGNNFLGGLVAYNDGGTISNSYWNTTNNTALSGVAGGSGSATGLSTQQMQDRSNFSGFNFTSTPGATGNNWVIVDKNGTLNNAGSVTGATSPMLASEYSTSIVNAHQLQLMAMDATASYSLGKNINAAATAGGDVWGSISAGFAPTFAPIGNTGTPFAGTFDGLGHTISNVTINLPSQTNVGLFGKTSADSVIQNVGLMGGSVTGDTNVGGLVGWSNGTITNSYATGSATNSGYYLGGLVGRNNSGTISNSYTTGNVNGNWYVGALVGGNYGVTSMISNSYATGSASGSFAAGGLVGWSNGSINDSHATGNITGDNLVGGLVGRNLGAISNSYATGSVTGTDRYYAGGLVGYNDGGTISNSYSSGSVSGTGSYVGGLVGRNLGTINTSYWNTTNNPLLSAGGGGDTSGATGLTSQQMQTASNFAGFTFTTTPGASGWVIVDKDGTLNNASGTGATSPMLASEYSTSIINAHQLQLMAMAPTVSYTLGTNINASATAGGDVWGSVSAGFVPSFAPVGNATTPFAGTFDGLGHTVSNLTINLPSQNNVGLFGVTSTAAVIQNVGLVSGSVTGGSNVGDLVGDNNGSVSNSYASGSVTGANFVGGLVGDNLNATISQSYATGSVTGESGSQLVGGLVGFNNAGSTISNSYATGRVIGSTFVGGLVGQIAGNSSTISNSYATGSVSGGSNVGGLVGLINYGTISNSYATGSVTGSTHVGGLVGANNYDSPINHSYWNRTNNPSLTGAGIGSNLGTTGLTSAQMMKASSFADWSISNTGGSGAVWRIYEGQTAPLLTSFLKPLTLSDAPDVSVAYDGAAHSGATTTNGFVLGTAATRTNAGIYNGYYSTQQGYDITGGNLTITGATLSAISFSGIRAYDGTRDVAASIFTLTGLVGGEDLTLTGVGTIDSKNVGTYSVSLGTLTLGNGSTGLASNYTFTGGTQTATITQADLVVSGLSASNKVYNALRNATLSGTAVVSKFGIDDVAVGGTAVGTFADKNVGTGKSITVTGNTLSGTDAGNYNLVEQTGLSANITQADMVISGLSASNKVYNALRNATLTGIAAVSRLGTDDVTLGGTAVGTFASKDVGSRAVTVTGKTLSGTDAGNYKLLQPTGLTATITKANLNVTGLSATGRVYNALTTDTLTGTARVTALGSDVVTLGGTAVGTFASAAVGLQAVTVTGKTLGGADAGNYNLLQQTGLSATITPNLLQQLLDLLKKVGK